MANDKGATVFGTQLVLRSSGKAKVVSVQEDLLSYRELCVATVFVGGGCLTTLSIGNVGLGNSEGAAQLVQKTDG